MEFKVKLQPHSGSSGLGVRRWNAGRGRSIRTLPSQSAQFADLASFKQGAPCPWSLFATGVVSPRFIRQQLRQRGCYRRVAVCW
eukprot:symbB.v1.2.017680.t1/scaffold1368.1/size123082/7